MIQEFKTKPTISGVVYYLIIDHENKTFTRNRLAFDGIRITSRDLHSMIVELKKSGYTEH